MKYLICLFLVGCNENFVVRSNDGLGGSSGAIQSSSGGNVSNNGGSGGFDIPGEGGVATGGVSTGGTIQNESCKEGLLKCDFWEVTEQTFYYDKTCQTPVAATSNELINNAIYCFGKDVYEKPLQAFKYNNSEIGTIYAVNGGCYLQSVSNYPLKFFSSPVLTSSEYAPKECR